MPKVTVIEDDLATREELANLLRSSGYDVVIPDTFTTDAILSSEPDIVLLDINLPGQNGEQLLKALRTESNVPVIMVTGSNTDTDEVISMSYGADDFITKPYNPHILLLRLAAVLKRSESSVQTLRFRHLRVDLSRGIIETDPENSSSRRKKVLLTKNEMIIMNHLLSHQGQIVSREALMTDLWNNHEYINDNALTVNISRLRTKLKMLGADDAIETRKGLGYVLS